MVRSNDFSEPYLPERYRQKIRDKQRKRLVKTILGVAIVIAITGSVLAILAAYFSSGTPPGSLTTPATGMPVSLSETPLMTPSPRTTALSGTALNDSDMSVSGITTQDATPLITLEEAQKRALRIISEKNGGALPPINLTSVQYSDRESSMQYPHGEYIFSFERLYLDHPVDTDGIQVTVDAGTGNVTGYNSRWTTPDYAFSQEDEPVITQQNAIFAVMDAVKSWFPARLEIRIISSELRWNNQQTSDSGQRPGSVPLAWKVTFDDDTPPVNNGSRTGGVAWVDIRTGNVTVNVAKN